MRQKATGLAAFAVLTGIILAGCGETTYPEPTPAGGSPMMAVGGGTPGVVDTGEFEICKHGTAATFQYSVNGGPTTNLSLADGECAVLAETTVLGPGNISVTTTELSDPAIVLDSMVATTNIIFNPGGTRGAPITGTATFNGTFNGDRGILIEYYNSVAPPPPPPPTGCTYTLGYWKNHTNVWPAPYTPGATFYASGKSWLTVLGTPPKGNVYYIVAHQFIAATLNSVGATVPANVQTAMNDANTYFLNPAGSPLTKSQLTAISTLLDDYNNGRLGVPHCP